MSPFASKTGIYIAFCVRMTRKACDEEAVEGQLHACQPVSNV